MPPASGSFWVRCSTFSRDKVHPYKRPAAPLNDVQIMVETSPSCAIVQVSANRNTTHKLEIFNLFLSVGAIHRYRRSLRSNGDHSLTTSVPRFMSTTYEPQTWSSPKGSTHCFRGGFPHAREENSAPGVSTHEAA